MKQSPETLSSPRSLENLMIECPNQVQISPNFVGMITRDLWIRPRNESTNYSMVWEKSTKFKARLGFSQELKNVDSKELVNPKRFVLSNIAWIHTKSSENHHKFVHHGHTNGNKKSITKSSWDVPNWMKTNAPRAQGGKGLLSQSIHVQKLNNPLLKSLTLERRWEGQGGEEEGA